MNALTPNPDNGFLESLSPSNYSFDAVKKIKLLEIAKEFSDRHEYPDLASLCDSVGIRLRTFYAHLQLDAKFQEEWNEIKARTESWLIQSLAVKARSANGVIANIALLRDINPNRWNPETKIIHGTNNSHSKELLSDAKQFIDAELVDNEGNTSTQV